MYDRFSDRARKTMQCANQIAQNFNHEYVGTEHLLLSLMETGGIAARALEELNVNLKKLKSEVYALVQSGPEIVIFGKLPVTPRLKKVLEYALDESRKSNSGYIGTEHLLLAIFVEKDGVGGQVLRNLNLTEDLIRQAISNCAKTGFEGFEELTPETKGVLFELLKNQHKKDTEDKCKEALQKITCILLSYFKDDVDSSLALESISQILEENR